jgi:hypothetical protein
MNMFDPLETYGVTWAPASKDLLPRAPVIYPLQEAGCYSYAGAWGPRGSAAGLLHVCCHASRGLPLLMPSGLAWTPNPAFRGR